MRRAATPLADHWAAVLVTPANRVDPNGEVPDCPCGCHAAPSDDNACSSRSESPFRCASRHVDGALLIIGCCKSLARPSEESASSVCSGSPFGWSCRQVDGAVLKTGLSPPGRFPPLK